MSTGRRAELFHERALAERVALVRLLLTLANFVVIWVDPALGFSQAYSMVAAGLFLLYSLVAYCAVRLGWARLDYYQLTSPLFDVVMSAYLIVMTGGYDSPFALWFVFAIVGSGFSRFRSLPVATTLGAMAALLLIARLPQHTPVDFSAFVARAFYLFGVAAVIAFLGSYLANMSKTLADVEESGRLLANAVTESDALRVFLWQTAALLKTSYARVAMENGGTYEVGTRIPAGGAIVKSYALAVGEMSLGEVVCEKTTAFTEQDDMLAEIMCERGASALQRFGVEGKLMEMAANEERARIADELHDTYLQTLAALDLRAEAARVVAGSYNPDLSEELQEIKRIAREAAGQARKVVQGATPPGEAGRVRLDRVFAERWRGQAEIQIDAELSLSDGQWRALEMLLREGLNNATKHGRANKVWFIVRRMGAKILARLEDNGKGPGEVIALGYGLMRLRTVLNQQGGMLHLETGREGGAALVAEMWVGDPG